MSEWIDCNLPWDTRYDLPELTPYPHDIINKRMQDRFGVASISDLRDECFGLWEKYIEVRDAFGNKFYTEKLPNGTMRTTFFDYEEAERLSEDTDEFRSHKVVRDRVDKIEVWCKLQPEVIAWHEENDKIRSEILSNRNSFVAKHLNKPGVLIEVEVPIYNADANDLPEFETKQFLIGDINEVRGVCDDCTEFESDTIVKRYKIVWSKEDA